MSPRYIDFGTNDFFRVDAVIGFCAAGQESARPIKRYVNDMYLDHNIIDATHGSKTQSLIFICGGKCILSAHSPLLILEKMREERQ
jgi:regulator of extracellular matrix RemA (YlzA/DUF370 family)